MYEIKVRNCKIIDSVYPPAFDLGIQINQDSNRIAPMSIRYLLIFQSAENGFEFLESITPTSGSINKLSRLATDLHSFIHVSAQLKNADSVNIVFRVYLVSGDSHDLAHDQMNLPLDRQQWFALCQAKDKLLPSGGVAPAHEARLLAEQLGSQIRKEMSMAQPSITEDKTTQLQKNIIDTQIEMVKNYLLDQPQFKELSKFAPLIETCTLMNIETRWAIAAAMLSAFEGYLKKWLLAHAGESIESLKGLEFHKLIERMRAQLRKEGIAADQTKLATLSSIRDYRNMVLHEMHKPTEQELATISTQTTELTKYIESLKKAPN